MKNDKMSLIRLLSTAAILSVGSAPAWAQDQAGASTSSASDTTGGEIIVTAQKRSQSINNVGMSITAATGDELLAKGVVDVSQLSKIVPGFNYNLTAYGTPVYTIRGVGFQDNSLGASPTVSVYVDEAPVAFSSQTLGAALDIERVEVLKGPQGTLFGGNSTGGAINYIAAKPTDSFKWGVDASYGRFNTVDLSGFVSGPISDTLKVRVAARTQQANAWQYSYTRDDQIGVVNQFIGRILADWTPTDNLKISLNVNGWRDRSDTPAAQAVKLSPTSPFPPPSAALVNYPLSPRNSRAADWDPGISFRQDSHFYQASGRIDLDLSSDIVLTSITSYQKYKRFQPMDTDGTALANFRIGLKGGTSTFFQELRVAGNAPGVNWMLGANYQRDKIHDINTFFIPFAVTSFLGNPENVSRQTVDTKAVFANGDYEIMDGLTVLGGIRYTEADRDYRGCTQDYDGTVAGSGFFPGATRGSCITLLNNFTLGEVTDTLDQNNISWKAGLNYKPSNGTLLYANVSRGYKSGSYPILSLAFEPQSSPVTQESVLAYEVGAKLNLGSTLQLNGAAFYYDYTNKQIRGRGVFAIFGVLELLVNIPQSRVIGFELDAAWKPITGLTIAPSVTMVDSKVRGNFTNFDVAGNQENFSGQAFPFTPKWSGNTDIEYRWAMRSDLTAFVGGNVNYQSVSYGDLARSAPFKIASYALVDLRAGIEGDKWTASLWGRNVFNKTYETSTGNIGDFITRYAGRPATYGVRLSYRY
ncbi:TonB-dependent receptor [soil metagenome]